MPTPWTPYGLEPQRAAMIRRRRTVLVAFVLLAGVSWLGWTAITSGGPNTGINTLGGGSQVTFDMEGRGQDGPTTVSVSPGGTALLGEPIDQPSTAPPAPRSQGGRVLPDTPYRYTDLFILYGPLLAAAYVALKLWKKRPGALEEVNFGIYKGAFPLEMITSSHRGLVFTSQSVGESIFGKGREDYVPDAVRAEGGDAAVVPFEPVQRGEGDRGA